MSNTGSKTTPQVVPFLEEKDFTAAGPTGVDLEARLPMSADDEAPRKARFRGPRKTWPYAVVLLAIIVAGVALGAFNGRGHSDAQAPAKVTAAVAETAPVNVAPPANTEALAPAPAVAEAPAVEAQPAEHPVTGAPSVEETKGVPGTTPQEKYHRLVHFQRDAKKWMATATNQNDFLLDENAKQANEIARLSKDNRSLRIQRLAFVGAVTALVVVVLFRALRRFLKNRRQAKAEAAASTP